MVLLLKKYPGIMLESININTWEVSFNLSTDSNNQGLSAKPLKHSDMNSWMSWYNGTSLPFSSCLLFSSLVLYCTLSYRNAHITGPHRHSGYEPVGSSSTWTDMLQHACGDKCLFALLNKICMWYYNIWYKMHDKWTQMRNTA